MRGGGRHKDKKSEAKHKRDRSPEKPEQTRGREAEFQPERNTGNLDDDDRRNSKPDEESGGDGQQQEARVDSVSDKGQAILESEKEKVIQLIECDERYRNIVAGLAEGNNIEAERKIQCYLTTFHELSGTDKGEMSTTECAIRWAVEARRERKGTEQEQESAFLRRGTVRGDASAEHRRAGGDEWICGGENRQRKCRSHPRER